MDDNEYEGAGILLELPYLIAESESLITPRFLFSFKWGATRKRSSSSLLPSLQSQPSVSGTVVGPTPTTCETEKEKGPSALSPTTPFLFSPSESDERPKQHSKRKVSLKRKKEEYLKMEEELTESKRTFKEEIKKLKSHYDHQKALNFKLKAATKERMIFDLQMQQLQTQLSLNHAIESTSTQPAVQIDIQGHHQQQLIMDRTAHNIEISPQYPHGQTQSLSSLTSNGEGLFTIHDNKVVPSTSLDLNIPLEESFTMKSVKSDDTRRTLLAAQARQRRIQIWRSKKLRSSFNL